MTDEPSTEHIPLQTKTVKMAKFGQVEPIPSYGTVETSIEHDELMRQAFVRFTTRLAVEELPPVVYHAGHHVPDTWWDMWKENHPRAARYLSAPRHRWVVVTVHLLPGYKYPEATLAVQPFGRAVKYHTLEAEWRDA